MGLPHTTSCHRHYAIVSKDVDDPVKFFVSTNRIVFVNTC